MRAWVLQAALAAFKIVIGHYGIEVLNRCHRAVTVLNGYFCSFSWFRLIKHYSWRPDHTFFGTDCWTCCGTRLRPRLERLANSLLHQGLSKRHLCLLGGLGCLMNNRLAFARARVFAGVGFRAQHFVNAVDAALDVVELGVVTLFLIGCRPFNHRVFPWLWLLLLPRLINLGLHDWRYIWIWCLCPHIRRLQLFGRAVCLNWRIIWVSCLENKGVRHRQVLHGLLVSNAFILWHFWAVNHFVDVCWFTYRANWFNQVARLCRRSWNSVQVIITKKAKFIMQLFWGCTWKINLRNWGTLLRCWFIILFCYYCITISRSFYRRFLNFTNKI